MLLFFRRSSCCAPRRASPGKGALIKFAGLFPEGYEIGREESLSPNGGFAEFYIQSAGDDSAELPPNLLGLSHPYYVPDTNRNRVAWQGSARPNPLAKWKRAKLNRRDLEQQRIGGWKDLEI